MATSEVYITEKRAPYLHDPFHYDEREEKFLMGVIAVSAVLLLSTFVWLLAAPSMNEQFVAEYDRNLNASMQYHREGGISP